MELKTSKTYNKTYLRPRFIWLFQSPANIPIFFDKKLDGSFCLCVDYQGLNNLTIKNQYLLSLISEAVDCLGQAKQFTQQNLPCDDHQMKIREDDEWKTVFQIKYGHFKY